MRLLYLILEDFMAYSKQRIDFSENGCFVITGENLDRGGKSNGSGKSSIFWGITMAIYNQARGKTLAESIKIGAKSCSIEIALVSGKRYYKILRKRKREGTSTTFLYVADNQDFNNAKDITGNDQNETQAKINSIMKMDYQSFCHSMYFKEDASSIFAQSTKSVRFNIIKNSLQVDRYDRYGKESKKDLDAVTQSLTELSAKISSGESLERELDEVYADIERNNITIQSLRGAIVAVEDRLSVIHDERNKCLRMLSEKTTVEGQRDNLIDVISELDRQINDIARRSRDHKTEYEDQKKKLLIIKEEIESLKSKKSKITPDSVEALDSKIGVLEVEMALNDAKIQEMSEKIEKIETSGGSKCWACSRPMNETEAKAIIAESKSVIALSRKSNEAISNELSSLKSLKRRALEETKSIGEIDSKLHQLEIRAATALDLGTRARNAFRALDPSEIQLKREQYVKKVEDVDRRLAEINSEVGSIVEKKESILREESVLMKRKDTAVSELAMANQLLGRNQARVTEIRTLLSEVAGCQKEIAALWNKRTVIENFLSACSKKGGIPSIMISQAIVEIEKFANDTLDKFDSYDGMQIKMEMSKPDEIDITVRMGSEVDFRDFDTFSGGERFIVSFAIRMALAQVLSRKYGADIKFILLDEAATSLDEYNTTRFAEMVKRMSKDSLILLITHQNNLMEYIPQNIFVQRSGGKSTIRGSV